MTQPYVQAVMDVAGFTPPQERAYAPEASSSLAPSTGTPQVQAQGTEQPQQTQQTTQQSTQQPSAEPQTKAGENYAINVGSYGQNPQISGIYQNLFAPVQKDVQDTATGLSKATGDFLGLVGGPRRTYQSMGGNDYLASILSGAKPEAEGRAMVGANYAGPEELNLDNLYGGVQHLQQHRSALAQPVGLEMLVGESTPGLTAGERAFEAQHLRGQDDYWQAQRAMESDLDRLLSEVPRAQSEAQAIAEQRRADESDIAKQSQAYLGGRKGELETAWDKAIAEAQAANKAKEDAYLKFKETGNTGDLNKAGFEGSKFDTETQKKMREGEALYQQVLNDPRFASIKDIPVMGLGMSGIGQQKYIFEPEWWEAHKGDRSKGDWAKVKKLARDRQRALEGAGFAAKSPSGRYTMVTGDDKRKGWEASKYSEVMPLYFGNKAELPDARTYVSFDPGMSPARENIGTKEQQELYSRIERILGEAQSFNPESPYEAYRAAAVVGDIDRFLTDEEKVMSEQKGKLSEAQKDWRKTVRKARRKFEDSQWSFNPLDVGKMFDQTSTSISNSLPSTNLEENFTNPQIASQILPGAGPLISGGIESGKKRNVKSSANSFAR